MTRFASELLGAHDRSAFASGNERIDRYFRETVSQDVRRRYALCYVLVEQATARIAGFYTLSSHGIALTAVPAALARKLPRYPSVPGALIGWLGRDLAFKGQHIGALLLYDAIARLAKSPAGVHAVCADAIDEAAADFYRTHQFQPLDSRPGGFFLPMQTALRLVGPGTGGKA
ncbi:MAG: GNAT family N-acetyltransferase [Rubrivivax sp.]